MEILVLAAHPVFQDVLQFERLFSESVLSFLGMFAIECEHLFFHLWMNLDRCVCSLAIFDAFPVDGDGWRIVCRTSHLVDVPVGLQIAEVADACIGAHAFSLLIVPEWEGVVVTICKDDGVSFLLQ